MQQLRALETGKAGPQGRADSFEGNLECCRQSLAALEIQLRESMRKQICELEAVLMECKELSKDFDEEHAVLIVRIEEAEQQVFCSCCW